MKRDMDLIRDILLEIYHFEGDCLPHLELINHQRDEVMYHVKLLMEEGLVEAVDASSSGGRYYLDFSLTWAGHDFVEAAESDTHWEKAKSTVIQTVGVLTVEALKIVLKEMMTKPFLL